MNNVRKAAKDGDWMSLMVEYAANKAGLGALIDQNSPSKPPTQTESRGETPLKPSKMKDLLHK